MDSMMLKGVCIITIVSCAGLLAYSIYNIIKTKKNSKRQDELNRQMFMAQNGIADSWQDKESVHSETSVNRTSEKQVVHELNYDEPERTEEENTTGKSLKDFFGPIETKNE